jgi:hypothetical protein
MMKNTDQENERCESCERLRAALAEALGSLRSSGDDSWGEDRANQIVKDYAIEQLVHDEK